MLLVWPSLLSYGLTLASVAILLAAAMHDVIARTVPNWMAITLAVLGIASRILHGSILIGFGAAAAVFVLAAFCWRRGWLGGGDVKLLAAATLWAGLAGTPALLITTGMLGGFMALFLLMPFGPQLVASARLLLGQIPRDQEEGSGVPVPYGIAIAGAALIVTLQPHLG
jgi:prepilin peptidase CpaA